MVVKWSTYAPSTLAILVQIPQKKMKFPTKETKIGKIKRGRGFTFYSDNPTDTKNNFFPKRQEKYKRDRGFWWWSSGQRNAPITLSILVQIPLTQKSYSDLCTKRRELV